MATSNRIRQIEERIGAAKGAKPLFIAQPAWMAPPDLPEGLTVATGALDIIWLREGVEVVGVALTAVAGFRKPTREEAETYARELLAAAKKQVPGATRMNPEATSVLAHEVRAAMQRAKDFVWRRCDACSREYESKADEEVTRCRPCR